MELRDALTLERYKLVTDRQKYFTELAKDSFASYVRFLAGLTAGTVTLISTKGLLELHSQVVLQLVNAIVYLVTFLGCVAGGQILFCLTRWYGFRGAESKINPETPAPGRTWWLFETLYVCAIVFSLVMVWGVKGALPDLLRK